ncbi:MAG: hypothetical protein LBD50_03505 [Rickettsiales bacterium]|nr:hypothetical protein [Rickettsiales bacterium]
MKRFLRWSKFFSQIRLRLVIPVVSFFIADGAANAIQLTSCPGGLTRYTEPGIIISQTVLPGYTCTLISLCEASAVAGCYLASDGDSDSTGIFEYTDNIHGICELTGM